MTFAPELPLIRFASGVYATGHATVCGPPLSASSATRNSPATPLVYEGCASDPDAANAWLAAVPSIIAAVVLPAARPETSWTSMEDWVVTFVVSWMTGFVPTSPAGVSIAQMLMPMALAVLSRKPTWVIEFSAASWTLVTVKAVVLEWAM